MVEEEIKRGEMLDLEETIGLSNDELSIILQDESFSGVIYEGSKMYGGVYPLFNNLTLTHFVKRSDQLGWPFTFKDDRGSEKILDAYNALKDNDIYSPNSKFMVGENLKGQKYLLSIMPKLRIINDFDKWHKEKKDRLRRLIEDIFGLNLTHNGDSSLPFNWGISKKGECFYHDLHVLPYEVYSSFCVGNF